MLGLTFQQLQKYEKGANRVSASRLHELSQILNVPQAFFFEEMTEGTKSHQPAAMTNEDRDPLAKRETLELVRAYYRIKDPAVRDRIKGLARALAN
jgi:transcriptional regulator with XRE-family HTH domain